MDVNVVKPITVSRIFNVCLAHISYSLSQFFKKSIAMGLPYVLTIEPTNYCNLRCPQCITGSGMMKRKACTLDLELYKSILDEIGDKVWYIVLYNQGEPFLHPQIIEMIKYAKSKNIYVITSTNGHYFNNQSFCEELIKSGIDKIIISLDGADADTYSSYRHGGDFEKVTSGIKRIIGTRTLLDSKTPEIIIQCLVMKQNEHQISEMKSLAKQLIVDKILFKTFQVLDTKKAGNYIPVSENLRRYETENGKVQLKNFKNRSCVRLWTSLTILSDGSVTPCCFDKNGDHVFGHIGKKKSVKSIWRSSIYEQFRSRNIRNRKSISICRNCSEGQKIYI